MRFVTMLALLATLAGCASSEERVDPDEPIEATAGDDEPIPGAPPGLDFRKVEEGQREALRLPDLFAEYRRALYEIIRLTLDGRPPVERRPEINDHLRAADRALGDISRIYNRLSSAYRELAIECRRRYGADDEYFGEGLSERALLQMRRQYRQMGDAFRTMGEQYDTQSDTTMDLLQEISGMRRGMDPSYR